MSLRRRVKRLAGRSRAWFRSTRLGQQANRRSVRRAGAGLLTFAAAFLTLSLPIANHYLDDPLASVVKRWLMAGIVFCVAVGLFSWLVTWIPRAKSAATLWRQVHLEDGRLLRVYSRNEAPRLEEIESIDARLRRAEGQASLAVCAEGKLIATLEEEILSVYTVSLRSGEEHLLGDRVHLHESVPTDCMLLGLGRSGHDKVAVVMTGGARTAAAPLSGISQPWDDWVRVAGPCRSAAFLGPTLLWVDCRGGLFPRKDVPRAVREAVQNQEVLSIDTAVIGVTAYLLIHLRTDSGSVTYIVNSRSGDVVSFLDSEEVPQTVSIMRETGWGATPITVLSAYGRSVSVHTALLGTAK